MWKKTTIMDLWISDIISYKLHIMKDINENLWIFGLKLFQISYLTFVASEIKSLFVQCSIRIDLYKKIHQFHWEIIVYRIN